MSNKPRQPKSFLIQIVVTGAAPIVTSYYEGIPISGTLNVNVGDHVAWSVQIGLTNTRKSPPYEVTFTDEAFFGVQSLKVPAGGVSPFLQVRPFHAKVSYSLNVN